MYDSSGQTAGTVARETTLLKLQPLKAFSSIDFNVLGKVMVVKELQPENAALPIVTSLLGKLTDLMFSQFSNADDAMKRVSGFIVQVDAALSIISIKYESAYLMLSTTGKDVHPSNASSMLVTVVGIFIVVKAEQSLKVPHLMFVKPSGSSIEVNAEHP